MSMSITNPTDNEHQESYWSEERSSSYWDNQVPPEIPAKGVVMPFNPAGLTDAEVRASLAQMAQAITMQAQDITMQAQAMTAQVNWQNVERDNPPVGSMADKMRERE